MIASVVTILEKQWILAGLFLGLVFVLRFDLLLVHSQDLIAVARQFGRGEALGYAENDEDRRMRMKSVLGSRHRELQWL